MPVMVSTRDLAMVMPNDRDSARMTWGGITPMAVTMASPTVAHDVAGVSGGLLGMA